MRKFCLTVEYLFNYTGIVIVEGIFICLRKRSPFAIVM